MLIDRLKMKGILAKTGRESFWFFFLFVFGAFEYMKRHPWDAWVDMELHKELCDWLEKHVKEWEEKRNRGEREPKRLLVEIFRGGGKSTIGCALDLWIQVRNPELAEIISSFDEDKSKEFLGVSRVVLEGKNPYGMFTDLYGDWSPKSDERIWAKDALVHTKRQNPSQRDFSFRTTSVSRGLTGSRPDVFRLDDPIVREKVITEGAKGHNWITKAREHLDSSRFAVKSNGLTIIFLTPYADRDVAGKCLTEEGIGSITCPRLQLGKDKYRTGGTWHVFYLPVRDEKGDSVLPGVYPNKRLEEMEHDDPDDFAAQMLCDPAAGKNNPLLQSDITNLWVPVHKIPPNLDVSVHLDTAFKSSEKRGKGDYSVIQVWGHDRTNGQVYYLDGYRSNEVSSAEYTDQLVIMLQKLKVAKQWPFVVTDDKEIGGKGGSYENFLLGACHRVGIPMPNYLPLSRSGTKKIDQRILGVVYAWKTGKVRLVSGAPEVNHLVYEMTNIGTCANDDMADAGADVFHPEVYSPDPGLLSGDIVVPARPYDELMWSKPGEWSLDEARFVYDQGAEDDEPKGWIE